MKKYFCIFLCIFLVTNFSLFSVTRDRREYNQNQNRNEVVIEIPNPIIRPVVLSSDVFIMPDTSLLYVFACGSVAGSVVAAGVWAAVLMLIK